MVKLTIAVAALVAVSLAGTRLQAQTERFASVDETMLVQDAQAPNAQVEEVQVPSVERSEALAPATQAVDDQSTDVQHSAVVIADAQAPVADAPVAAEPVAAAGPTIDAAALSPRLHRNAAFRTHAMRKPSGGSGVGLMILGGAALVTGLIIGDDAGTVIAVGGAIVGLYGLYVFLGRPSGMEHGAAAHSQRIGLGYKLNTN